MLPGSAAQLRRHPLYVRVCALPLEPRAVLVVIAAVPVLVLLAGINAATVNTRFFTIEFEGNLTSWYSSMVYAVAGLTAGEAVLRSRRRGVWRPYAAVAAVMLLFSIDEMSQLHEGAKAAAGVVEGWTEVLAALASAAVLVWAGIGLGGVARRLLVGAAAVLLAAETLDTISYLVHMPYLPRYSMSVTEEMLEIVVGAQVLGAVWRAGRAGPHGSLP